MSERVKYDIPMYQGEQRGYKFTFYSNAAQTIPWDFSSASSVVMSVKRTFDMTTELFTVTATNGQDGSNFASGIAVFVVTGNQSKLLERDGKYDVFVTMSGAPISPVHGDVNLKRAVKSL